MRRKIYLNVLAIILLTLVLGAVASPRMPDFNLFGKNLGQTLRELKIKLGLDLQGGAHLVYRADMSSIPPDSLEESLSGIRDVIERRVNAYGVSEPQILTNKSGEEYRIIVDLAGVTNVEAAIAMIGETPVLDFREENEVEVTQLTSEEQPEILDQPFKLTLLTGKNLKQAAVIFDQNTQEPQVSLQFDDEGKKMFKEITERNVGKRLAIFLDGEPITVPVVQTIIADGRAVITGSGDISEAKELAKRLNAGALPVPIELISQEKVGASLGATSLKKSLTAGLLGMGLVSGFMLTLYLICGLVAVISLSFYTVAIVAVFKILGITLTLSGIAGFILSVGMAVDANILIFERIKEELKEGRPVKMAISNGFKRAWPSIRDGNISTLITCVVLTSLGTGMVKGFAITLGIGITLSMFTAVFVTRNILEFLEISLKDKLVIGFKRKK